MCVGGTDSDTAPNDQCLLIFMSLCNPLPLSVDRTYDLLLSNRKWQWWDPTSMNRLHEILTCSLFWVGSLPCWLWRNKLSYCELSCGIIYMARNWEWPWLTVSKKLNTAFNHVSLEADTSLSESSDETLTLSIASLAVPWNREASLIHRN